MKTIFLDKDSQLTTPSAVTIGCFDGVHRGHQLLIRRMLEEAQREGLTSTVITFDRQPQQLFDPTFHPQLLSTLQEKERWISAMGVEQLVVLPFTRELATLSAQAFMEQVLRRQLQARVLVTGYDNRFGHDRREGFEDYQRYGVELGMSVQRGDVDKIEGRQEAVSSSVIRQLLCQGLVGEAATLLSRPYELSGKVVSGRHIGHELGFPTANLQPDNADKLIPEAGVYAVWVRIDNQHLPAMMNIGTRPTFEGHRQTLEVHILDYDADLYGQSMTVEFIDRLRQERRFNSPEELVAQLRLDQEEVTRRLAI